MGLKEYRSGGEPPGKERILICVPTCMRPKMLGECLRTLARTTPPAAFDVALLVLDNDAKESARAAFAEIRCPFPARYVVEHRRGISSVRNRAIDEAKSENSACLAFVDDDETVEAGWLCALVEGMEQTGADVVGGSVAQAFPNGGSPWWIRPDKIASIEGVKITTGGFTAGLCLMKARLFSEIRFDERFNLTGAGDYDFALRAARRGFVFAATGQARAFEKVVSRRLTFRNYFLSQWQRQTGYVLSHRLADGFGASLRFLPKGIAKIIKGVLCCAVAPLCGQAMLRRGVKNLIAGSGLCYGVFAHGNFQKYAKIDGE